MTVESHEMLYRNCKSYNGVLKVHKGSWGNKLCKNRGSMGSFATADGITLSLAQVIVKVTIVIDITIVVIGVVCIITIVNIAVGLIIGNVLLSSFSPVLSPSLTLSSAWSSSSAMFLSSSFSPVLSPLSTLPSAWSSSSTLFSLSLQPPLHRRAITID